MSSSLYRCSNSFVQNCRWFREKIDSLIWILQNYCHRVLVRFVVIVISFLVFPFSPCSCKWWSKWRNQVRSRLNNYQWEWSGYTAASRYWPGMWLISKIRMSNPIAPSVPVALKRAVYWGLLRVNREMQILPVCWIRVALKYLRLEEKKKASPGGRGIILWMKNQ